MKKCINNEIYSDKYFFFLKKKGCVAIAPPIAHKIAAILCGIGVPIARKHLQHNIITHIQVPTALLTSSLDIHSSKNDSKIKPKQQNIFFEVFQQTIIVSYLISYNFIPNLIVPLRNSQFNKI